jgi:hypothetical protein
MKTAKMNKISTTRMCTFEDDADRNDDDETRPAKRPSAATASVYSLETRGSE